MQTPTGATSKSITEISDRLFSEILLFQRKYDGIKPPTEELSLVMVDMLKKLSQAKGKNPVLPYISSGRGHGPFTELIDGSVKYDLIGAIGPNLLGHSHPIYIKAHLEAATSDTIMCGNLLPYHESLSLAEELLEQLTNTKLKHFWYCGSGSFANDTALKILWQKKAPKYKIFAFEKAFAGRSVATQDITYSESYREGMPSSIQVTHIPHYDQSNPQLSSQKTIEALNIAWEQEPESYCALMIEIIQGEAGFVYGDTDYYRAIFEWAKEKGLYIWVDEVQTFGRTTELFAFQAFKLDSYVDIVTVGKVLQACGVLFSEELNPKPGLVAGTFNGALSALNAGKKIVQFLTNGNFYGPKGRIHYLGESFKKRLHDLSRNQCIGKIPYIGGQGTMISFEVGDSSKQISLAFVHQLLKNGVISYIAGNNPTRIRFLLPISLKDEHIDEIFNIIENTINEIIH